MDTYYYSREDYTTQCEERTDIDEYYYEYDHERDNYESEQYSSWNRFLSADQADAEQI